MPNLSQLKRERMFVAVFRAESEVSNDVRIPVGYKCEFAL